MAVLGNTGGGTRKLRISNPGSRARSSLGGGGGRCLRGRVSGVERWGILERFGSSSAIH
jgi:hypothetical protein